MLNIVLTVLCGESPLETNQLDDLNALQNTSIKNFLAREERVRQLNRNKVEIDVCDGRGHYQWGSVTCEEGIVREIRVCQGDRENFSIEYLPGSVRRFLMPFSGQTYVINTRRLPRELQVLNIRFNNIHGTFNLETLPGLMTEIRADNNEVSGIVSLLRLPNTIQNISFTANAIHQTVFYGNIPLSLSLVDLNWNPLTAIRPLSNRDSKQGGVRVDGRCLYAESFISKGPSS